MWMSADRRAVRRVRSVGTGYGIVVTSDTHEPEASRTDRTDSGDRTTSTRSAEATSHPQPGSDEADREKETTPAGIARDLEEKADDMGASTGPAPEEPE